MLFAHISLDDACTRDILLHHGIDLIELFLHGIEHRAHLSDDKKHHDKLYRYRHGYDYAESGIERERLDYAADKEYRRAEKHTQSCRHKLLNHRDIVCHSRDERACGEIVRLLYRERHHLGKGGFAQTVSEILRGIGGEKRRAHAEYAAEDDIYQHLYAHRQYNIHPTAVYYTFIYYLRHHGRKLKIDKHLAHHKYRRPYGNKPIWLQI